MKFKHCGCLCIHAWCSGRDFFVAWTTFLTEHVRVCIRDECSYITRKCRTSLYDCTCIWLCNELLRGPPKESLTFSRSHFFLDDAGENLQLLLTSSCLLLVSLLSFSWHDKEPYDLPHSINLHAVLHIVKVTHVFFQYFISFFIHYKQRTDDLIACFLKESLRKKWNASQSGILKTSLFRITGYRLHSSPYAVTGTMLKIQQRWVPEYMLLPLRSAGLWRLVVLCIVTNISEECGSCLQDYKPIQPSRPQSTKYSLVAVPQFWNHFV